MTNAYVHRGTGLIVQLESDPSGMVVAYVPSLPGCVSQGETVADALGNIDEAIAGVVAVMQEDGTIGGLAVHQGSWDRIEYETGTKTASA